MQNDRLFHAGRLALHLTLLAALLIVLWSHAGLVPACLRIVATWECVAGRTRCDQGHLGWFIAGSSFEPGRRSLGLAGYSEIHYHNESTAANFVSSGISTGSKRIIAATATCSTFQQASGHLHDGGDVPAQHDIPATQASCCHVAAAKAASQQRS